MTVPGRARELPPALDSIASAQQIRECDHDVPAMELARPIGINGTSGGELANSAV